MVARLRDAVLADDRASQPAATAVDTGVLYFVTDEDVLERSNGTTWDQVATNGGGGGMTNPMTTADDLIIGGASGVPTRLATTASKSLVTDGSGVISWGTAPAGNYSGVLWSSGTSMPGSPATGQRITRTDLGLDFYYDGTRWLSTNLMVQQLGSWSNVSAASSVQGPVFADTYDQWLVSFRAVMYAASGLDASKYWRLDLYTPDDATLGSAIATVNIQSGANATYIRKTAAIGALLGTGKDGFVADLVKVSTPGNFYGAVMVTSRLVGT